MAAALEHIIRGLSRHGGQFPNESWLRHRDLRAVIVGRNAKEKRINRHSSLSENPKSSWFGYQSRSPTGS